ncbi:hypothetical protein [Streptomyces sp. NPDC001678]|uniref:hypothetical protein n=1 Tax=Streptomyces sp. NPDC001678 TaxID=3364599 RepID=UPI0036AA6830
MKQDGSYRAQQTLLHTLRVEEAENAHRRSLERDAINAQDRIQEAAAGNRYEIERDWRQAHIGIHVKAIQERMDRQLEESPFSYSQEEFYELVYEATRGGTVPALLIAPFYRDDLSGQENDEGPHSFRVSIRQSWLQSEWSTDLVCLDGALKRPLHKTDMDILVLQRALQSLPVVLVHGGVQSNHRVWPSLYAWNIVDSPELRSVHVSFPPLSLPASGPSNQDHAAHRLAFEDELGGSTAITAGLIAEWFHLVRHGRMPRLHTMLPANMGAERRVIAAGLATSFEVALERHRIDVVSARVGQAMMYLEAGLRDHAENAALLALTAADTASRGSFPASIGTLRQLSSTLVSLGRTDEANRARLILESAARNNVLRNLGWRNR